MNDDLRARPTDDVDGCGEPVAMALVASVMLAVALFTRRTRRR